MGTTNGWKRLPGTRVDDVKPSTGDRVRDDPDELWLRPPEAKQRKRVGGDRVKRCEEFELSVYYDAPRGRIVRVATVDFESRCCITVEARHFRPGRAAEADCSVVDDEVDRKDLRAT